jgi:hypothetical protein
MLTARTMIIASAIAATGIVLMTEPSLSGQTVGVEPTKLQDRHPGMNLGDALRDALKAEGKGQSIPAPASTPKSDRLDVAGSNGCERATWPNIPAACLTVVDRTPVSNVRTVTIEQDTNERVSFVSLSGPIVAQR